MYGRFKNTDAARVGQDAEDVDMEAFAERTLQVRSEIRQRIS